MSLGSAADLAMFPSRTPSASCGWSRGMEGAGTATHAATQLYSSLSLILQHEMKGLSSAILSFGGLPS